MSISASKVEVAWKCEGSLALPQRDETHPGQDDGVKRHDERDQAIKAGNPPEVLTTRWPGYTWRAEVALAFDVATGKGWEIGQGIGRRYGDLGPFAIPGTADVIGRGPAGELVVLDWKSFDPNVSRAAVNAQLHTLALAATRAYGVDSCEVAISHEVRPLDVAELDFANLEMFHVELRALVERSATARQRVRDGLKLTLTTGDHCRWCGAFNDCDAQKLLALEVSNGAAAMRFELLMPLEDDDTARRAYEFFERVKMLTARLRSALYARGAERPIPLGDGRWFGKNPKLGATKIDADVAYNVIREKHGQEVADAAIERKASQAGIKRGLEFAGAKGKVAELQRDVMAEIKKRGGTRREETEAIEEFTHALSAVND